MLAEMEDMAIDFQEEALSKRLLQLKLAKEAQRELSRRLDVKAKLELRLRE